MRIQWYPGHMTKTRRMIQDQLKLVDIVCELLDARIPLSSRNPDIDELAGDKPRLIILNRVDQADEGETRRWVDYFKGGGFPVLETDCRSGKGVKSFAPEVRRIMRPRLEQDREKGRNRPIRALIVGVPNVGKSSLINRLTGQKSAKTENRPGVTRGKQWFTVERGLELLDTPGILWPKFDDAATGMALAYTGAIRDAIIDTETLAAHLMLLLADRYPAALTGRYKIGPDFSEQNGFDLLEAAARKRGFLISGGEVDTQRMADVLLDEFRGQKLGRITLEPVVCAPEEGV
ncbi:ribosome biogenesis GTPase YlqF [Oscillospiraceae bacterium OttesenSCG-928-F05]|nr:ribosome biogenesis GTPase YlqF [Oscillospiraceae bacterium OttesenSCG-928-F05]